MNNRSAEPTFGLEVLYKIDENYPETLKEYWGEKVVQESLVWFEAACGKAVEVGAKIICFAVNIDDVSEIETARGVVEKTSEIAAGFELTFMLKGAGAKDLDAALLPELIPLLKKPSIIAPVQDKNYVQIVGVAAKGGHTCVLRTPIDINLTKELNILSIDEGLAAENILIDPDMGCVSYGLDYGYSIIERIVAAREGEKGGGGDKMLDMPIIVFTGVESFKAKEAKSTDFTPFWGPVEVRSLTWEISTTTALLCAGADIAIVWHPDTVTALREVLPCQI